jgi:hypothetical protein
LHVVERYRDRTAVSAGTVELGGLIANVFGWHLETLPDARLLTAARSRLGVLHFG